MPCGILVVDKPEGWTSHDVVSKLRHLLHEKRAGHAGTLDPMATGVLPVFLGRATRAVDFAATGDKEYVAGLRLGLVTDTQDTTGTVLSAFSGPLPSRAETEAVLDRFRGEIGQVPPMYSALKYHGKKLYELARKGVEIERPPRPVTIYELELLEERAPGEYGLRVRCSKGTYVRTLCHDIGAALGCGGVMSSLRRTRAAGFSLEQAVPMDQLILAAEAGETEKLILPVDCLFSSLPAVTLSGEPERLCRCGNPFPFSGDEGRYRVYGADGEFLMLGSAAGGSMAVVKNFFAV